MEDIADDNELKLYTQLYESSIPKWNEGLNKLKEKAKIYDINPNLNYQIMKKMLGKKNMNNEDINAFCDFYRDYIQTLFHDQKLDIIKILNERKNRDIKNAIKFKLNEKSYIDSYFDIIKVLCEVSSKLNISEKINYDKIKELFYYDYFVDNYAINTPLIYGTTELIFAGLINNLYHHLFIDKKENIDTSTIDTITGYAEYPKSILKKIEPKKKKKKKVTKSNIIKMDIVEELPQKDNVFKPIEFDSKIYFISPFLSKILSNDFKEIFNLNDIKKENSSNIYEVKPKMNSLIFHLLFLDLIFHIYNIYDVDTYISKFNHQFFFETKREKLNFFESIQNIRNEIIIVDENEKEVKDEKDISNKIYTIFNKRNRREKVEFNPYDYNLSKFTSIKNFNDLVKRLSDIDCFSLNKFFIENRLYNNNELNTFFKENIQEMLSSKTISELFRQYFNFSDYICPYSGEEKEKFINQTFDIIYYFPIPFEKIAGFTYKSFGLIFISNINRFEKIIKYKDNNSINYEFCQQINKLSFLKVVHIHEIIGHYSYTIIHSNNNEISLSTPPNTSKDYEPKSEESVLLGNKIKNIYTKAALFLINNNNYKLKLEKFNKEFIGKSKINKEDIFNFMEESKNSQFVGEFINQFFNEEIPKNSIKLNKYYITAFRINDETQIIGNEFFHKGVSCFERATHIFPKYKKIQ